MNTTPTMQNPVHHRGHRGTVRSNQVFSAVKTVFLMMFLTLALFATTTHAEDYSNNIGFMKNPPKELKEKFPMCDQFLDVKWIRQFPNGGWVGTVTADVYFGDKKEQRELVVMQEHREYDISVNSKVLYVFDISESAYRISKIEEMILSSDEVYSRYFGSGDAGMRGLALEKSGKLTKITRRGFRPSIENGLHTKSYSYFSKNICISLPDKSGGWIIEGRGKVVNERFIF